MRHKKLYSSLVFVLFFPTCFVQAVELDLSQAIRLACDSTLDAFRFRDLFLAQYWEYRNYKARRLPNLTLNLTPMQYNRDIVKRYISETDMDVYRTQQSLYSYGNLSVTQNLDLTGGTFYVNSELVLPAFRTDCLQSVFQCPVARGIFAGLAWIQSFQMGEAHRTCEIRTCAEGTGL